MNLIKLVAIIVLSGLTMAILDESMGAEFVETTSSLKGSIRDLILMATGWLIANTAINIVSDKYRRE